MLDPDPAQPQFFAIGEPVNIVTGADADRQRGERQRLRGHEIARICEFVQCFVAVDQGNLQSGGCGHLGIVSGIGGSVPFAVRRQNIVIAERLRGLDPAQQFAIGSRAHEFVFASGACLCGFDEDHAVGDRQHRDGTGME